MYLNAQVGRPKVSKVIAVLHFKKVAKTKELLQEDAWLTGYAKFFDDAQEEALLNHGRIVKYLPDGLLAVFAEDAADGINWAIKIQENIGDEKNRSRYFDCETECAIAITYGGVAEIVTDRDDVIDYIGTVVDRAIFLAQAGKRGAVLLDKEARDETYMKRVTSIYGSAALKPPRTSGDYLGEMASIEGAGLRQQFGWYEILWSDIRYGLDDRFDALYAQKPSLSDTPQSQPRYVSGRAGSTAPLTDQRSLVTQPDTEWIKGSVSNLSDRYGFIAARTGEDYWFNPEYLFRRNYTVGISDIVWFIPLPPLRNAKSPRASQVLPLGASLFGTIEKIVRDKGYGFIRCDTSAGEQHNLFIFLGDLVDRCDIGTQLEFKIGENAKGPVGINPQIIEPTETLDTKPFQS